MEIPNLRQHLHTVDDHAPQNFTKLADALGVGQKARAGLAGRNWNELKQVVSQARQEATESRETLIEYASSKFAEPFHQDSTSRLKALMSNVGTGKSSTCIMELLRLGCLQPPAKDGVRYSRTAVIRATFSQLENTTLATWKHWLPAKICRIKKGSRLTGHIHEKLADGTTLDMEFVFMALDSDQWLDNLQGLEITYFWINEFVELRSPKEVLSHLMSRLGRYPSKQVSPIRWTGGLLDYNPPKIGSYAYNLFETDAKPESFTLYKYDPPLLMTPDPDDPDDMSKATYMPNPEADYVRFQNLGYDYWLNYVSDFASDANRIRRMVLGEYTFVDDGNPVFVRFRQSKNVGLTTRSPNRKLLIGIDGGLTPSAVFGQLVNGGLHVHETITTDDCTFKELWEHYVEPLMVEKYPGFRIQVALDKGSDNRSEVDGNTIRKYLMQKQISTWVCNENHIAPRLDAVNWFLDRTNGMVIDQSSARVMVEAMSGGYCWKTTRGESTYGSARRTVPDKASPYSHPADALQALCLMIRRGAGGGHDHVDNDYWSGDSLISRSAQGRTHAAAGRGGLAQRKKYYYA